MWIGLFFYLSPCDLYGLEYMPLGPSIAWDNGKGMDCEGFLRFFTGLWAALLLFSWRIQNMALPPSGSLSLVFLNKVSLGMIFLFFCQKPQPQGSGALLLKATLSTLDILFLLTTSWTCFPRAASLDRLPLESFEPSVTLTPGVPFCSVWILSL